MSETELTMKEEFELREKRIKLMHPILYVAAAVWATLFICMGNGTITEDIIPVFCGGITVVSLLIIEIIMYAFSELRCLQIKEKVSESIKSETDKLYENIWIYSGIGFGVSLIFVVLHFGMIGEMNIVFFYCAFFIFALIFALSCIFSSACRWIFKDKWKERFIKKANPVLELMRLFISPALLYSLFVLLSQAVILNA